MNNDMYITSDELKEFIKMGNWKVTKLKLEEDFPQCLKLKDKPKEKEFRFKDIWLWEDIKKWLIKKAQRNIKISKQTELIMTDEVIKLLGIKEAKFFSLRKEESFVKPIVLFPNSNKYHWIKEEVVKWVDEEKKFLDSKVYVNRKTIREEKICPIEYLEDKSFPTPVWSVLYKGKGGLYKVDEIKEWMSKRNGKGN